MKKMAYFRSVVMISILPAAFMAFAPGCRRPADEELRSRLSSAVDAGNMAKARKAIDSIVKHETNEWQTVSFIEPQIAKLIREQKFDEAKELSEFIRKKYARKSNVANLACTIDIQCVVASRKWEELKPVYLECIRQLPDQQLVRLMRYVFASLKKAGQDALLEECVRSGISDAAGKQSAVDYAALQWANTQLKDDSKRLPALLQELRDTTGVSANQIGTIFINHFYDLAGDKASVKQLCAIGSDLIKSCTDNNVVSDLKVKILDGAFITEDYDLAVSMLEQGIPGKDDLWHAMSLPKVKAHRAQANNNPREAVKFYREFMDCWKNSEKEEEVDPQTHITYSKEWILARNAKRIADILASIPDEAEAQKARDEAKEYFTIAMEKAKEDKAALDLVTKEAAKLLE